ncbi:hypothetical protein ABB02_01146 [Clostridiaceae bacterium JG1575]|nr:hypothetical protein ABB02_01146 [Clostridiaceae bacterium JG1575]
MIRALLFDLDGTVADTNGLILASFRHTFSAHGVEGVADEAITALFGEPLDRSMTRFKPAESAAMVATYRVHNKAHHDDLIRPFPGVQEALTALKEKGYLLGIVTSKRQEMASRSLACLGLAPFFDVVVTPENTKEHKPHPAPVLYAMARLGVSPEETLMIGDSPYDLLSGRAAGCQTVAVSWSSLPRTVLEDAKPTFFLEDINDLMPLLAGPLGGVQ